MTSWLLQIFLAPFYALYVTLHWCGDRVGDFMELFGAEFDDEEGGES